MVWMTWIKLKSESLLIQNLLLRFSFYQYSYEIYREKHLYQLSQRIEMNKWMATQFFVFKFEKYMMVYKLRKIIPIYDRKNQFNCTW